MRLVSSLCQFVVFFFPIEFGTYHLFLVYLNIGMVNSACLRIHLMVKTRHAEHLGQCLEHMHFHNRIPVLVFLFPYSAADYLEW